MTSSWTNWLEPTAIVLAAGPPKGTLGVGRSFSRLLVLLLTQSVSLNAQITDTDTEVQQGTTFAIVAQDGLGDPKQELSARFGDQTPVLTAVTNLLAESGLPWQIATRTADLGEMKKDIAVLDAQISSLDSDSAKIQARIVALDPSDPDYATKLAQLQAALEAKQAERSAKQAQRDALALQRDALQEQISALGTSPLPRYGQENLNGFAAELRKAADPVLNTVVTNLPAGPVLLVNDAFVRATNICCWGPRFSELTNWSATSRWSFAESALTRVEDAKMRTTNRDYSYTMVGGLITVNVEVSTQYYGPFLINLCKPSGPVVTNEPALPWGQLGQSYDLQLGATGGVPGVTFTTPACPPPPGLTLEASGRLHGVPSTNGAFCFTARTQDAAGQTNGLRLRLYVLPAVKPELRLAVQPHDQELWPLDIIATTNSSWRIEESTNLVEWVNPGGMDFWIGTNFMRRYLKQEHIAPRRYYRGRLLPW